MSCFLKGKAAVSLWRVGVILALSALGRVGVKRTVSAGVSEDLGNRRVNFSPTAEKTTYTPLLHSYVGRAPALFAR